MYKAIVEHFKYKSDTSYKSTFSGKTKEIVADTEIGLFEIFYKMNNRLRYCNGEHWVFQDKEQGSRYTEWLKSDDYKKKSFELYYGNGVVD